MAKAEIGLIGLGTMGANLALNIAEKGVRIAVFNRTAERTRQFHARAAESGVAVPALSAALSHFDSYRRARGTANLIQAQRDFFGAHGFERVDAPGEHHGPCNKTTRP